MYNVHHKNLIKVLSKLFDSNVCIINGYFIVDSLVEKSSNGNRHILLFQVNDIGQLSTEGISCIIRNGRLCTEDGYFYRSNNTWVYTTYAELPMPEFVTLKFNALTLKTLKLELSDLVDIQSKKIELYVGNSFSINSSTISGTAAIIDGKVKYMLDLTESP